MEKIDKENGTVRLTPSLESNWLHNGNGSFGKVVDCPADKVYVWEEVSNEFKEQWEAEELRKQEENLPN